MPHIHEYKIETPSRYSQRVNPDMEFKGVCRCGDVIMIPPTRLGGIDPGDYDVKVRL